MNAPEPHLSVLSPADTYEQVSRASNDIAGRLAARLRRHTQGEVLFTAADRGRYATDASIYQVMPVGVFLPRYAHEVPEAMAICRDLGVPILPRGGGTSQCGQTVGAGLVIDHSKHLRGLLHLDLAQRCAEVQPGLVLDHLNRQLKPHGLWFAVDVSTGAQATLGGMAGNNSCGSRSIAYGNMVHNVLGLTAWQSDGALLQLGAYQHSSGRARELGDFVKHLADGLGGEIALHWPKLLRRVAGYNLDIFCNQSERPYTTDGSVNLAHLLVGSEGTLGMTQSISLKLSELPGARVLGVVNFPSFHRAMEATQHIVKLGEGSLTAVELVDRTMLALSLENPAFAATIRQALIGTPEAILLVEFAGTNKNELKLKLRQLAALMGDLGLPGSVVELSDELSQKKLWDVRKAGLNIMMSLKGDGKPVSFIEDCAVPLEHLSQYTDQLSEVFKRHGTRGTWYAHASVGTLHVRPILDMRRQGASQMRRIAEEASVLVRKYRGAYSGEHGDGLCRGEWIQWQFGPKINQAFAAIKQHLDPLNLLSPQRIVNPPAMDERSLMRYGPAYKVIPIQTALDWRAWDVQNNPLTEEISSPGTGGDPAQGFAKAVDMCNNNGTCRNFDAGTMCPSYRVTRDEQHLTRGRANTLRLALSGQLDDQGLASPALMEAMDLCVSCKGCRRDCPTGVDMARMKIETLHHYKSRHGYALKDRLIAYLPLYAPFAARFSGLLNLRNRLPVLARWAELLTGLSARRSWPTWQAQHFFNQGPAGVSAQDLLRAEKPLVLFVDTFNGYFESDNARAAFRVLSAAGYSIHLASKAGRNSGAGGPHLCCGRTFLSQGLVDQARKQAGELINALLPFAKRGIPIVGLEPSCLLTLRDEALVMGLGEAAQTVGAEAVLLEEFLAREAKAGRLLGLSTQLRPAQQPILVHGHCHQKAFGLMPDVLEVIRLIPGAEPELIDSSCCGMAGSFGYEAAHESVSMDMAELSLLPALRARPEALWVADGTSCRHQIRQASARPAIHVAQLLSEHLRD